MSKTGTTRHSTRLRQIILALLLFLPVWSLRFWEAWLYWILFAVGVLIMTLYFLKHGPCLIVRRRTVGPGAEQEKSQKVIQAIAGAFACALVIVPGRAGERPARSYA